MAAPVGLNRVMVSGIAQKLRVPVEGATGNAVMKKVDAVPGAAKT